MSDEVVNYSDVCTSSSGTERTKKTTTDLSSKKTLPFPLLYNVHLYSRFEFTTWIILLCEQEQVGLSVIRTSLSVSGITAKVIS